MFKSKKIAAYKSLLKEAKKRQTLGHKLYCGEPVKKRITQLEFEVFTRQRFGDKARETILNYQINYNEK